MEQHFGRRISELESIVAFLEEACRVYDLDSGIRFVLNMAVEELYTNMVKYNKEGAADILIGVQVQNDSLLIDLVDFDSKPFDFKNKKPVQVQAGLHERTPGGLGIHLVEQYMDEVSYSFLEGKTSIRLIKHLTTHA